MDVARQGNGSGQLTGIYPTARTFRKHENLLLQFKVDQTQNPGRLMVDISNSLSLPFIQPSQAQKHVTHNEALQILDVLTQLTVISDETATPPPAPAEAASYIVATGSTGDWAGHEAEIAVFETGGWQFFIPRAGWRAFVLNRETLVVYDGAEWIDLENDELQDVTQLGLGMTAPLATPFAAKLNAALWTALTQSEGGTGDVITTMNKEAASDDAGFTLQTNFETRAVLGLFGNDNLRLAVSPDGGTFFDGFEVERTSGVVSLPNLPRCKVHINFDNFCAADAWTRIALNTSEYNDQAVFDAGSNQFTAPVSGTYAFGATLVFKENTTSAVTTSCRLIKNGSSVLSGSQVANTGPHVSEETTVQLQTVSALDTGDVVELEGKINGADGYFVADQTAFWAYKIG